MKYYKIGTNQFQKKHKNHWIKPLISYITIVTAFVLVGKYIPEYKVQAEIMSPLPLNISWDTPPVHKENLTQEDLIKQEIKDVFGVHANKAFKLLSCENGKLNPLAVHDNEKWGQGKGKDWGIFQINDHWQGVSNKSFLTDWKINIRMAWNIYSRDHNSFKLWACSKKVGVD